MASPHAVPRWAGVVLGLLVVAIVGLLLFASRPRHDDNLEEVDRVRAIDGGRAVEATVTVNSCGEPLRLVVDESATEVRVVALVRGDMGADCDDIAIEHTLRAELDDELGDRALIAGRP